MAALIPLSTIDPTLVEALLDRVFGDNRHARTAYRIRTGMEPLEGLCFAALDTEDYLVGSIQAWPVGLRAADGKLHPLVMIGPVAVLPERQGDGFGQALMAACLGAMTQDAEPPFVEPSAPSLRQSPPIPPALPQVLIGDADYYGRWGFSANSAQSWHCPGPYEQERLLVRCANPAILPEAGMLGPWEAPAKP